MNEGFQLKDSVTPTFKPKSVRFAAVDLINNEMDKLEKLGVISRIDYPKWVAPTVYVKKCVLIFRRD